MLYDDKKFIGSVIRNARKNMGLSQAELSEKIGMTDKNLGNIENGKQFPQVNNFLKIMEELQLTVEDFGSRIYPKTSNADIELLKIILSASKKENDVYLSVIKALKSNVTTF